MPLPDIEAYDDLFLMRQASHSWLLDSRPRDALNTHDIRVQSSHPALSHETIMGKPDDARKQQQTTKWYINAYLHANRADVLPLDEGVLDCLQFGGKRNYGYGITGLKDTQVVDLEALDYSRLEVRLRRVSSEARRTPLESVSELRGKDEDHWVR